MQVVHAGEHRFLKLDLDAEVITDVCRQAGLEVRFDDSGRALVLEVTASGRQSPLLLFDARDSGNQAWFGKCQFYVDGTSGNVLQTPFNIANARDASGVVLHNGLRIAIAKELPTGFRLPGRQAVSEQVLYGVLFNFLSALVGTGVAVCGGSSIRPLAGRG